MQFKIALMLFILKLVQSHGLASDNKAVVSDDYRKFVPNHIFNNEHELNVNYEIADNYTRTRNEWRTVDDFISDVFDWTWDSGEGRALSERSVKFGSGGGGGGHHKRKGKGKSKKKQQGFMEKVLPMMVMPFLVSTSMIPMILITLLGMLFKSAIIGKIGIILTLINMFRSRNSSGGGVYSHNINMENLAMEHYGYRGDEEYGAYINRKKRRKRQV